MFGFFKKKDQGQPSATPEVTPEAPPATPEPTAPLAAPLTNLAPKPKKNKKTLMMISAITGGLFALYLAFAFITVAMAEEGKDFSLTKMFGMEAASFLNALVIGIHIVIMLIALTVFVFVMIALFKMLLAKKEEIEKKKKAKKNLIITGVILFVILIAWIAAFVYLESRREVLKINIEYQAIETTPEDTLLQKAPLMVKFDATHAPIDQERYQILSYDWDFGDGETGTNKIVTHEYTTKGNFDVILTITKRDKLTGQEVKDSYTKPVTIADQDLTASFKADPQAGEAPLEVKFDAEASVDPDGKIDTYEWDLDGDGEFDKDYDDMIEVEYTYEKIGNYEVMLRVTNLIGDFKVAKKQIVVGMGETPEAVVEVQGDPETFEKGVTYIFKGGESTSPNGDIVAYEWDFGDGTSVETTKTVSHSFKSEGVFEVILKVTDEDDKTGETIFEVITGEKPGVPKAILETTPALGAGALAIEGEIPFEVEFDGSKSTDSDGNIVDYEWDFDDDGKTDSFGKKVSHTFTEEGTYTVRMSVIDADENYDAVTIGVKVLAQGMRADLSASTQNGEVPLTVSFDASGSHHPGGEISSYKWDFGDGTNPILGSAKISHKYTEIGEYTASVTVIGTDNSKDTAEAHIVVRAVEVSACFKATPTKGKAPLQVSFNPDCSTGSITSYSWEFGDGEASSDLKPIHTFETPGLYPATLEVIDNNNTVSTTIVDIEVQAPKIPTE